MRATMKQADGASAPRRGPAPPNPPDRRSPLRNRLEYWLARFALWSMSVGSRELGLRVARGWVFLIDTAVPRLRRTAQKNLDKVLTSEPPESRASIADESFRSIARILLTLARLHTISRDNAAGWIRYDGLEYFHEAKRCGKGVLFATAHLGNWELSAFAHGLLTEPMHVVARALDNPLLDGLVHRLRTLSGNQTIEKRDFARGILRALGRKEAVGILIDQNTSAAEGIFVPFFGIPACVDKGFARIAAHSSAAIIPGYALWSDEENRYILKFYPPMYATGDVEQDTARLHAHLESVIREHPGQWLWMHRRWKTRPPGEQPLY